MRWTFLDSVLLTATAIAAILFHHQIILATPRCVLSTCAPEKIYSGAGVIFWEFEIIDCRRCACPTGWCEEGPWGSNCQPNQAVNQRRRELTSADLKCSCVSEFSYCEAWSDSGVGGGAWEDAGKQEWCQGIVTPGEP